MSILTVSPPQKKKLTMKSYFCSVTVTDKQAKKSAHHNKDITPTSSNENQLGGKRVYLNMLASMFHYLVEKILFFYDIHFKQK